MASLARAPIAALPEVAHKFGVVGRTREGESLQKVRGVMAAILVGVPLALFMVLGPTLHAPREIGVVVGVGVGIAIFAVVATRSDAHDDAADAAWREAALDLPPVSDRIILARVQASMPGPGKHRRSQTPPRDDSYRVKDDATSERADEK